MKKFTISCDFNGQMSPFTIYVGEPKPDHHPVSFQSNWLSKERGGTIPQEVMDSLAKLKDLAEKNGVSFEELCVYALGAAQEEAEENGELAEPEESSEATEEGTEGEAEVTAEAEEAPLEEAGLTDEELKEAGLGDEDLELGTEETAETAEEETPAEVEAEEAAKPSETPIAEATNTEEITATEQPKPAEKAPEKKPVATEKTTEEDKKDKPEA